ncbi:MAG: MBL fold metallo-hydrolase [Acidobacteriota bacterium]
MTITDGIEMLELDMDVWGQKSIIYPTLIWDKNNVVLVDAGMPSNLSAIMSYLEKISNRADNLTVVVTHQDLDHIAGLPELIRTYERCVNVLAHEEEKPYIEGKRPLIKVNPDRINKLFASFPEEHRVKMLAVANKPPKCPVDRTVIDGEELPWCGGIIVIHTPGHTPGHICLYHKRSKTLIAGDALIAHEGILLPPIAQATFDMDLALQSLKKLTRYDIEYVICYHGGLCKGAMNQRIAEIASSS